MTVDFERHLAPARLCRPCGILPSEGFSTPLPRGLVVGAKRRGIILAVLPQRATPKIRLLSPGRKDCSDNETGGCVGFALTARLGMVAKKSRGRLPIAVYGLPGRCFASLTAFCNGLDAIYSGIP